MTYRYLVYPEGYQNSTCGYCSPPGMRSKERNNCSVGISPAALPCSLYQGMIDRGWRRSGEYCYKPDLRRSCCPQYTIKLDALEFSPSKSQRKVVSRWNRFIVDGSPEDIDVGGAKSDSGIQKTKSKKGVTVSFLSSIHASEMEIAFCEGNHLAHRFDVILEPSSYTEEKFNLYKTYQASIHNDRRESPSGFQRFLVDSPLERTPIFYTKEPPKCLPKEYGAYHQLYRVDGQLIAMAVLDILPSCVSSVYFMYDNQWGKYSLGKLSAMREASLVREIHEFGANDMKYLYMGFYIPSCQKMRYKGEYAPSYLLDPEEYTWHPLDTCVGLLKDHRYASFAHPAHSLAGNNYPPLVEEEEISDEEGKNIFTMDRNQGIQPIKSSLYWREPLLRLAMLQTIHGLGHDLSKECIFAF